MPNDYVNWYNLHGYWLAAKRKPVDKRLDPGATTWSPPGPSLTKDGTYPNPIEGDTVPARKSTATATPDGDTPAEDSTAGLASISLRRLQRVEYQFAIVGTAPLIVNRWSEKARNMMLEKQQTRARAKPEAKDPEANFEASRYRLADGRDGFPAVGFKAAIVHAARFFQGVTQVQLKQSIVVLGDDLDTRGDALVVLDYDELVMREDTPRNASGVADLRYRAMYLGWSANLRIRTIAGQIDEESLVALVDAAGVGGVGEWRPTSPKSATGSYGTFEVVSGIAGPEGN